MKKQSVFNGLMVGILVVTMLLVNGSLAAQAAPESVQTLKADEITETSAVPHVAGGDTDVWAKDSDLIGDVQITEASSADDLPAGVWATRASMSTTHSAVAAAVVNDKLYAVGGDQCFGCDIQTVEEYTPSTDTWTTRANMPTARHYLGAATVDGILYAIGGQNAGTPLATVEAYYPITDTWTTLADMPAPRTQFGLVAIGEKLYAVGGSSDGYGSSVLNSLEEYDPVANTWTSRASMPTARTWLGVTALGGKLYAVGGRGIGGAYLSTVEEYDPATDTWTSLSPMPTARGSLGVTTLNGKLYAVGGCDWNGGGYLSTVEEYDPIAKIWITRANMPTARNNLGLVAINGKLYAVGGDNGHFLATLEEYTPPLTVSLSGSTTGVVNTSNIFTATTTATTPITYVWEASGQSPVTHSAVSRLTDTVSFIWNLAGVQVVTVTANYSGGSFTNVYTITIQPYAPSPSDIVISDSYNGSTLGNYQGNGSLTYVNSAPGLGQAAAFTPGNYLKYVLPGWYQWPWTYDATDKRGSVDLWVYPEKYDIGLVHFNWHDTTSYPCCSGHILHLTIDASGKVAVGGWTSVIGPSEPLTPMPAGSATIPLNQWTHIAYTWGDAGTRVYVNGVLDAATPSNFYPALNSTVYMYVPYFGNAGLGYIDDLRVSKNPVDTFLVSGRVTDNSSQPLAGVAVSTGNVTVTTNASGYYTLTTLLSGAYTITALRPEYNFLPLTHTVVITTADVSGQNFTGAQMAPSTITLTTPTSAYADLPYVVVATVSSLTIATPITYTWEASEKTTVIHPSLSAFTDTVAFTWNTAGPHFITVTAQNADGAVTASHSFLLNLSPSTLGPADNLARNTGGAYPNADESDRGWGGGANKPQILDGYRNCPTGWACGLAFTGGQANYVEACGWRQATISFGTPQTFTRLLIWHNRLQDIPYSYKISYWNETSWVEIFSTTNGHNYIKYPISPDMWPWQHTTENTFAPVTASKVRYSPYNCDTDHGWIYEFEVFNDAPSGVVLSGPTTGLVDVAQPFTATVAPITITKPITYTWQATGQTPIIHTGSMAYTDTANFTWSVGGAKTITVTASNAAGVVTATHTITVQHSAGMISYWKFDESNGTVAADVVGGHDGAVYEAARTTGQVGGALHFDGTNDRVEVAYDPAFKPDGRFSVEAWIYPESNISEQVILGALGPSRYQVLIIGNQIALNYYYTAVCSPCYYIVGADLPALGQWHHIAATYEESGASATTKVYIDGVKQAEFTGEPIYRGTVEEPAYIGGNYNWPWAQTEFIGSIDEVALYNRALTAEEIQRHYQNGLNGLGYDAAASFVLTVSKAGNGTGTVSSIPAGIDCGSDCTEDYALNTPVTLTATPATGSTFASWSGCGSVSGNQCTVTMTADKTVTATFTSLPTNAVTLTLSDGSGTPGSTGNRVTISADNQTVNTTPIAGAQFEVIYDSRTGITLASASPTSRASSFNTSVSQDRTNPAAVKATILLYNPSGQIIASGTGPILDLLFDVNSLATPGVTSTLMFSSALLSDAAGNSILADYRDAGRFTILSPCACGDVNCDGSVNIFDLQRLINMILHTPQPDSTLYPLDQWTRADLTGDGQWNIFDLQRLINCILGRGCVCATQGVLVRSASNPRRPAGTNVISLPDVTAQPGGSGSFDIGLNNQDTAAGSQIQFTYSPTVGLNVTGARVASRTTGFNTSFTLDTSDPAQTRVTVLLYNMSGLTLAPGSGPIVAIDYTLAPTATGSTPLSLTLALLSDSSGATLPVTPINGSFTVQNAAPTADFLATPLNGLTPLTVTFTDQSTGAITAWLWNFGDGATSTIQNPTHTYTQTGSYTVTLTVTGPGGTDSRTRTGYIAAVQGAAIGFNPTSLDIPLGLVRPLTITVWPNGQDVSGVQVHVRLAPAYLQIITMTPGSSLPLLMDAPAFDPATGVLHYGGAASLGTVITQPFDVLVVMVRAITLTTGTSATFLGDFPPTDVSGPGGSVLQASLDGTIEIVPGPDLAVSLPDGGAVSAGQTVTLSVVARNLSNQAASSIELTATLPNYATFVDTYWVALGSGLYRYSIAQLAGGEMVTVPFRVRVDSILQSGIETTLFTVRIGDDSSHGPDMTPANNTATATIPISAAPDLVVYTSDHGLAGAPGSWVTYTIAYSNTGTQNATGVVLTETLPLYTSYAGGSWTSLGGDVYRQTIGDLAAGATGLVSFTVRITDSLPASILAITNTVSIGDDGNNGPDLNPANNVATDTTPTTAVLLIGRVDLQGRPAAPHSAWAVPLTVRLYPAGGTTAVYTRAVPTDSSGQFRLEGLAPGSYDVRVKNSHTLQNVKRAVNLVPGENTVYLGTLLEGNVNDNNLVTIADFGVLSSAFSACFGGGRFVENADLNEDNCVTILDFGLLAGNFNKQGDLTSTLAYALAPAKAVSHAAQIRLEPSLSSVAVGQLFTLAIRVEPNGEAVNGAMVNLKYDPETLDIMSFALGATLTTPVGTAENLSGRLRFAAGRLGETVSEPFILARVQARLIKETRSSVITFDSSFPATDISSPTGSVMDSATSCEVQSLHRVFLPMVVR